MELTNAIIRRKDISDIIYVLELNKRYGADLNHWRNELKNLNRIIISYSGTQER